MLVHLTQRSGSDPRINIWSSSTTKYNNIVRSCPKRKLEFIVQPFISEDLKMEVHTTKNLVIGSAEQTGNRLPRRLRKQKSNIKDCVQRTNELAIESRMADEYYKNGNIDELIKNQLRVQDFESPRKDFKPFQEEVLLTERDTNGMMKSFPFKSQIDHCAVICDPHLTSEAQGKDDAESKCKGALQYSSATSKKILAKNKVQEEHQSSSKDMRKHVSSTAVDKVDSLVVTHSPLEKIPQALLKRKLLILDVNGVLADVVSPPPKDCKGDINILRRAIFKRPFYLEFLRLCFDKFDVGIWSSRSKKIVDRVVDYLLGDLKHSLLFCWDLSQCTKTGLYTLENRHKPLVCKELKKVWEVYDDNLPWKRGFYNESNTLLLDDSPHKALLNPMHSAVFPYSFHYKDRHDTSLGPGGDLRVYVEKLATADNMMKYVEKHPFGQRHIDETSSCWDFYSRVFCDGSTISTPSYVGNGLSNSVSSHILVKES